MELFYSGNTDGKSVVLDEEETRHCIKVLRYKKGDEAAVIDGNGGLLRCRIVSDSGKNAVAEILSVTENWGGHDYDLEMAVCPTKNIDRYEWFVEKACEIGVDSIVPVIGEHSERKVVKTERLRKILVSAAKQSLKGKVPALGEAMPVREYIEKMRDQDGLKMIAYCFEDENCPRISIKEALESRLADGVSKVRILIGPEGDFSREEAEFAVQCGFVPVHLGPSRLRTETAGVAGVFEVYHYYMQ